MTSRAYDPGSGQFVYFTDLVAEGDVVSVYRDFESAESEVGPWRQMRVVRTDEGRWQLEPAPDQRHPAVERVIGLLTDGRS